MKNYFKIFTFITLLLSSCVSFAYEFSITAIPPQVPPQVLPGQIFTVQYQVQNTSKKTYASAGYISNNRGITQVVAAGLCGGRSQDPTNPPGRFKLTPGESCTLELQINTTLLGPVGTKINSGPKVCTNPSLADGGHCNEPLFPLQRLNIKVINASQAVTLSVSPNPNIVSPNATFVWTITNTSTTTPAYIVDVNFGSFASAIVAGSEVRTNCDAIPKNSTCTITAKAGPNAAALTNIQFSGANANPVTVGAAIVAPIQVSPSAISFGSPTDTSNNTITITNNTPVDVTSIAVDLSGAGHTGVSISTNGCTGTLLPTHSCQITFGATANSYGTGTLNVNYLEGGDPGPAVPISISIADTTVTFSGGPITSAATAYTITNDPAGFTWQGPLVSYNLTNMNVSFVSSTCPLVVGSPISPGNSCTVTFQATGPITAPVGVGSLTAMGTNLLTTSTSLMAESFVNVSIAPDAEQHLQYKFLTVTAFNDPIQIQTATLSAAVSGVTTVCASTDGSTCDYTSDATCDVGSSLPANTSCNLVIKALATSGGNPIPIGAHPGGTLTLVIKDQTTMSTIDVVFTVDQLLALYAAGSFQTAGSTPVSSIAYWDGSAWNAPAGGSPSEIARALALFKGDLYLGGDFASIVGISGTTFIGKWNGATWSSIGNFAGTSPGVTSLIKTTAGEPTDTGGTLIIGGGFTGPSAELAVWNGTTLSSYNNSSVTGGAINALAYGPDPTHSGNTLYSGSGFPTYTPPGSELPGVAFWSNSGAGQWELPPCSPTCNTSFTSAVNALLFVGSDLYVGGNFTQVTDAPLAATRVALWDESTSTWSTLPSGSNNGFNNPVDGFAYDPVSTNIYAAGTFTQLGDGSTSMKYISLWDGSSWNAVAGDTIDITNISNSVNVPYVYNNQLFIGGTFVTSDTGAITLNNIASCNIGPSSSCSTGQWSALDGGLTRTIITPQVIDLLAAPSLTLSVPP